MSSRLSRSLLLRTGLRYQLRHRWQLALALIGIAMGVAVVLAVDLANAAAKASFALSSQQLRGTATHRIVGTSDSIPEAIYRNLFTSAGHPPMAPVILARTRIDGYEGRIRLIGLDLFAEGAFREQLPGLIQGEASVSDWLARPNAAALSASAAEWLGVTTGDELMLTHQGRPYPLQVFAISEDDSLASRDLIVVDIATAQAVSDLRGALSHIDLILDDTEALAWVEARLPPSVRLVDIGEQTRNTAGLSAAFELNLTAMSLLALLVGVFLIFNAISFSIVQRRRLLGRLRAIGVRADELFRLILAEALVLALVGGLIGSLLGYWLGQVLTQIVAATVSELYYQVSADAMHLSWPVLAKAWLLGLAGTLAAAWLPARQAARTPPLTTLSRTALEDRTRVLLPWLAGLGACLLLTGLIIALSFPGGVLTGFAGLFMLLLGAALVTPTTLRLAHCLFTRFPLTGLWRLAIRDLDRHLSRLSTAAAALMIALAASVGVAVMVESMRSAVSDWLLDALRADLYITADGYEDGASLPPEVVQQTPTLAPVTAYSSYRTRKLQIEGRRASLIASDLTATSRMGFEFVARETDSPWTDFDQGAILISEPLAYRLSLSPGDLLSLPTPTGERDFPVAAIFRDFASEHGRLFIAADLYRQLWNDSAVDTLALFTASGKTSDLLQAASAQFSTRYDLVFTAAEEIYAESMAVFGRTFRITEVLRLLSVAVAFIGILSALMALQLERRKEHAILRALGLTGRQVSQLIMIESATLGLLAALLAVPTGLAMAWVLTAAIQQRAFGWSMPFQADPGPLLTTLVIGLAAALLASLYPAWRAGRQSPASQMRED